MLVIPLRLLVVPLVLLAGARLGSAQIVEVVPEGVSVRLPGGIGASGAAAAPVQSILLRSDDLARNLSFQLNRLAPALSQPLPDQLRGAVQAQVRAGAPLSQALATQNVLVQALTDAKILTAIQEHLLRAATPENSALAGRLAVLAAAAQNARSREELGRYTAQLKGVLADTLAGDDQAAERLFDGLLPRKDAAGRSDAPAVAEGAARNPGEAGKILRPLTKPTDHQQAPRAEVPGVIVSASLSDDVQRDLAPYIDGPTNVRTRGILNAYMRSGDYSAVKGEILRMVSEESQRRLPLVRLILTRRQKALLAVRERLAAADSPAVQEWRIRYKALGDSLAAGSDEFHARRLLEAHYAWVQTMVAAGRFTPYYARLSNGYVYPLIEGFPALNDSAMSAVARYPIEN